MGTETPVDIRGWTGLNIREEPGLIGDRELSICKDFDLGMAGELNRRPGFELLHAEPSSSITWSSLSGNTWSSESTSTWIFGSVFGNNPSKMLYFFKTASLGQLIASNGTDVFFSVDGMTWHICSGGPWSHVQHAVQYSDKLYLVRDNNTVLQWDGTTMTALIGSPSGTFCAVFKDRLFVINSLSTTLGSRLFFSAIADFTSWLSTNTLDVNPGDGDFLVASTIIYDVLYLFKTRSTWSLYIRGLPTDWTLRVSNTRIGCVAKDTIRSIEGKTFFLGTRGVYHTDGYTYTNISQPIALDLRNTVISSSILNIAAAAWWDDKYIIFLPIFQPNVSVTWASLSTKSWDSQTSNNWLFPSNEQGFFVYTFHLLVNGWTEYRDILSASAMPGSMVEVYTDSPIRGLYCGDHQNLGRIFRYGSGAMTDNGHQFSSVFQTKEFDYSEVDRAKRSKLVEIESTGQGSASYINIPDTITQPAQAIATIPRRASYKIAGAGYFRVWKLWGSVTALGPLSIHMLRHRITVKSRQSGGIG